jgi:hypothetical protein
MNMKMKGLYFGYGRGESFTSKKLADKPDGYSVPVRELMQNSLDASRDAGNDKCEINIYLETIQKSQIPFIEKYEETLEIAVQGLKERNAYSPGNQQVVESIREVLRKDSINILKFVDNGTGMKQQKIESLLDEMSSHDDNSAGGSYGVGNLTSYFLSSIRYVLYATKYEDKDTGEIKQLWTGSTILSEHRNNGKRGSKGRIIDSFDGDESDPSYNYPIVFPDFLKPQMDELDSTGSMVIILGLNEEWDSKAEYAIASNFFYSITNNNLSVNIHKDGEVTQITIDKIEELLASKQTNTLAGRKDKAILSGQATYQAYQAISDYGAEKNIELSNGDEVSVFIKEVESKSTIALIRNGMLIARHDGMSSTSIRSVRDSFDYENFIAVINVDKNKSKKFLRLIRNSETPYHDELKLKKEIGPQDVDEFKELFSELSEKIKNHLTIIPIDDYELPFFNLPDKSETKGAAPQFSGQNEQSKEKVIKPPRPPKKCEVCNASPCICPCPKCGEKPCICETPPPKPKLKPEINLRQLSSNNEMRYTSKEKHIEIIMRVKPDKQPDKRDGVYFSIAVSEDNDNSTRNNFIEFLNLSINGKEISESNFISGNMQVGLGKLNSEEYYNIKAKVKKPNRFDDMKVALEPIFGLKQTDENKEQ